jgi:hypothetical protein
MIKLILEWGSYISYDHKYHGFAGEILVVQYLMFLNGCHTRI